MSLLKRHTGEQSTHVLTFVLKEGLSHILPDISLTFHRNSFLHLRHTQNNSRVLWRC